MKTKYICKCGRVVEKSTTADNTGNRDTAGCEGCPYLLSWGPDRYVQGQGFVKDIQGYECRMSPSISYASTYYGRADDKTTLRIVSLDLDFLEEIQAWMDGHAEGLLSGGFSRDTIRGTDYSQAGRYSWSISCAQNKKGMAAKAALIQKFFRPDKSRRGKTPEEEKAIVLAAIEEGKAAIRRKEDKEEHMETTKRTNDRGIMTDVGELFLNGSECRRYVARRARTEMGKVQAIHVCDDQPEGTQIWMNASYPGEYWVLLEAGKIEGEHVESCPYCAALLGIGCGDVLLVPFGAELKSNKLPKIPEENNEPACSCAGCKREDCICAGGHDTAGRADCTGEQNCAQSGCTYAAKHRANPPTPADADASPCAPGASDVPPSPSQSAAADAQQGANDDLPEVCHGCRCATCGNEDCPTPCHQKSDEVEECEQLGPMGDDCEDYQPKEDAECLKTPAPNGDVAAITAANAATKPSRVAETTTTSENGADVSGFPNALTAPQPAEGCADIATNAPSSMPTFDYSGLDDQTVADLHLAEREIRNGRKMAEMGIQRMADGVAIAHDTLCGSCDKLSQLKHGNRGENTFGAWCESLGLHRKAAYRLLQVSRLFDDSTPREQKALRELTNSVLYEASRPSAEPEAVEALKRQQVKTLKEFRALEAQIKAERQAREKAEHDAQRYREDSEKAREAAHTYHCQYEQVNDQRNALLDQQGEYAARVVDAEQRAKEAEERARAAQSGQAQQLADAKKQWQAAAAREKQAAVDAAIEQAHTDVRASAAVDVLFDQLENTVAALQAALETLESTDADKAARLRRSLARLLQTLAAQMGVG